MLFIIAAGIFVCTLPLRKYRMHEIMLPNIIKLTTHAHTDENLCSYVGECVINRNIKTEHEKYINLISIKTK